MLLPLNLLLLSASSQGQGQDEVYPGSCKSEPPHVFSSLIDALGEMARMATLMAGCIHSLGLDEAWRGHSVHSPASRQHWNYPY